MVSFLVFQDFAVPVKLTVSCLKYGSHAYARFPLYLHPDVLPTDVFLVFPHPPSRRWAPRSIDLSMWAPKITGPVISIRCLSSGDL